MINSTIITSKIDQYKGKILIEKLNFRPEANAKFETFAKQYS
jgi:hypothetical protein